MEAKRRGRLNQADIAGRLGVSVSTVSRALANDAGISASVRQDIQTLARTLGYKGKRALDRTGGWRATVFVGIGSATGACRDSISTSSRRCAAQRRTAG